MNYYPIQESGAAAQFPMARTRRWLTLETATLGGHVARGLQPEARRVHWELDYVDLSDTEASAVRQLFEQSKGGLKNFVFVDPLANLLRNSEQPAGVPWSAGGLSVVPGGGETPAVFNVTNSSQGVGTLGQNLTLAGGEFCLSCWVLGAAGQTVGLRIGSAWRGIQMTGGWQRVWYTAAAESSGTTLCALELAAGQAVKVHSLQLERQPTPSPYHAGTATGGVYSETRFEQESLDVVATGPNRNGVRVKLVSRLTE